MIDKPDDNIAAVSVVIAWKQVYEPMQHIQEGDKIAQEQSWYAINELPIIEEYI